MAPMRGKDKFMGFLLGIWTPVFAAHGPVEIPRVAVADRKGPGTAGQLEVNLQPASRKCHLVLPEKPLTAPAWTRSKTCKIGGQYSQESWSPVKAWRRPWIVDSATVIGRNNGSTSANHHAGGST